MTGSSEAAFALVLDDQSRAILASNSGGLFGAVRLLGDGVATVVPAAGSGAAREIVHLGAPQPNPASHGTELSLDLARTSPVIAEVIDVTGRRVRSLISVAAMSPGRHVLTWDGATDSGTPIADGVYFLEVDAGGRRATRRVVVLR